MNKKYSKKKYSKKSRQQKSRSRKPSQERLSFKDSDLKRAIKQTQELIQNSRLEDTSTKPSLATPAPTPDVSHSTIQLDEWQKKAVQHLEDGYNVVVDAPTTAGKTRVVETFFSQHLQDPQFRAAYTTPVKSLSNDKLLEFRELFGEKNVGIATGDVKENLNAPIVVTTLETYRNSLLGVEPDLGRSLVVFDEYHFMQDVSRGSAWEEAIILTPENCQLLLLSASVSNANEIVDWLCAIHDRSARLIEVKNRPVPLEDLIYLKGHWIAKSFLPKNLLNRKTFYTQKQRLMPLPLTQIALRLASIESLGLCPAIVYAGRRKTAESLANELSREVSPLTREARETLSQKLQDLDQHFQGLRLFPSSLRRLIQHWGIAYHHSGLAPTVRAMIEGLLKEGLLRFCSATMGLSIGINFSVRSTAISDFTRPGSAGITRYSPSEVLQMLGRAGRRGRDKMGFSLWVNQEAYGLLGHNLHREPCVSQLRNDPTTFLGLVAQGRSYRDIEKFYSKSFLRFKNNGIDLSLISRQRVLKKLNVKDLPCHSPAYAYLQPRKNSPCRQCPHRTPCHQYLRQKESNDLTALQLHLIQLGAFNEKEQLTPYGHLAKYFPQAGGLVIARFLLDHDYNKATMTECLELMASFSLARYKKPMVPTQYSFPFDTDDLEETLEAHYPFELFPELYDEHPKDNDTPKLIDFNPQAGFIIKAWHEGMPWRELEQLVTHQQFATGDLMSVIYRVATYVQSLALCHDAPFAAYASEVREALLRPPLSYF